MQCFLEADRFKVLLQLPGVSPFPGGGHDEGVADDEVLAAAADVAQDRELRLELDVAVDEPPEELKMRNNNDDELKTLIIRVTKQHPLWSVAWLQYFIFNITINNL